MKIWILALFFIVAPLRAEVIDFSSDDGLVWDMQKFKVSMHKNATARTEAYTLRADEIEADYRSAADKRIYRIFAKGGVALDSEQERILSDTMTYDIDGDTITLDPIDNPVRLYNGGIEMTAAGPVAYHRAKGFATATRVSVAESGRTLTADAARVEFARAGGRDELSRIVADGNVKIVDGQEEMFGDTANYNPATGLASITGNARFKKGPGAEINGGKIIYDMKTGVANILPSSADEKVTGTFSTGAGAKK